jgi:hypothetical protein
MNQPIRSLPQPPCILRDEKGVVIIAALLVLVLLTIIGIAAINTSNTEVQIAGHQWAYLQGLYEAEGAAVATIQLIESQPDLKNLPPGWLVTIPEDIEAVDTNVLNNSFWEDASATLPNTSRQAVHRGLDRGTSLDMASSKVHLISIRGRSSSQNGSAAIIELGYNIAY